MVSLTTLRDKQYMLVILKRDTFEPLNLYKKRYVLHHRKIPDKVTHHMLLAQDVFFVMRTNNMPPAFFPVLSRRWTSR